MARAATPRRTAEDLQDGVVKWVGIIEAVVGVSACVLRNAEPVVAEGAIFF
jgi:hypothetical protein